MINKPTLLSQKEIDDISRINNMFRNLINDLGDVNLKKLELESRDLYLKQHYIDLQNTQNKIINDLTQKYGEGDIDLEQGMYIPKQT